MSHAYYDLSIEYPDHYTGKEVPSGFLLEPKRGKSSNTVGELTKGCEGYIDDEEVSLTFLSKYYPEVLFTLYVGKRFG